MKGSQEPEMRHNIAVHEGEFYVKLPSNHNPRLQRLKLVLWVFSTLRYKSEHYLEKCTYRMLSIWNTNRPICCLESSVCSAV
jgi:hypothetical protein